VDVYNARMAKDTRLPPIIRQIHFLHHRDEARHLVFGREYVKELFARYAPRWSSETRQGVGAYLAGYLAATWREYYNPDVYRDAGLADPFGLQQLALRAPACGEHRRQVTARATRYLLENDVLDQEPVI
jgi:hypothetical protein